MTATQQIQGWDTALDVMPLSNLCALTGISLPNLSAYKSGAKAMSVDSVKKLHVAAAAGPDSVILKHGLSSWPVMGAVVKKYLLEDPSWCVSVIAQGIQQAKEHLETDADIEAFHNKPVHIAHPGWRALVEGCALLSWQACGKTGMPWWVQYTPLPQPWAPFDYGKGYWAVWATVPMALKELNVIVGDGVLKAV